MIWVATALATPPEGVVPDDLSRWETAAQSVLRGPPGCWVLGGRVSVRIIGLSSASGSDRGSAAEQRFTGAFSGLLEDGAWKTLSYDLHPADRPDEPADLTVPLLPTVGRFDPAVLHRTNPPEKPSMSIGVGDGAVDVIGQVFDELGAGGTSYAEWDESLAAIELYQDVVLKDHPRLDPVRVYTVFPAGGPASKVDVAFPRRLREGSFPFTLTLYDLQMHLRTAVVDDAVLPAADSVSFGLAFLGMTFGFEQQLTWESAARCQ